MYFIVTVSYNKRLTRKVKNVKESVLVNAATHTEAEAKAIEYFEPMIRFSPVNEVGQKSDLQTEKISRFRLDDIILTPGVHDNFFYKVVVGVEMSNERDPDSKKVVKHTFIIQESDTNAAITRANDLVGGMVDGFHVVSTSIFKIVDVVDENDINVAFEVVNDEPVEEAIEVEVEQEPQGQHLIAEEGWQPPQFDYNPDQEEDTAPQEEPSITEEDQPDEQPDSTTDPTHLWPDQAPTFDDPEF